MYSITVVLISIYSSFQCISSARNVRKKHSRLNGGVLIDSTKGVAVEETSSYKFVGETCQLLNSLRGEALIKAKIIYSSVNVEKPMCALFVAVDNNEPDTIELIKDNNLFIQHRGEDNSVLAYVAMFALDDTDPKRNVAEPQDVLNELARECTAAAVESANQKYEKLVARANQIMFKNRSVVISDIPILGRTHKEVLEYFLINTKLMLSLVDDIAYTPKGVYRRNIDKTDVIARPLGKQQKETSLDFFNIYPLVNEGNAERLNMQFTSLLELADYMMQVDELPTLQRVQTLLPLPLLSNCKGNPFNYTNFIMHSEYYYMMLTSSPVTKKANAVKKLGRDQMDNATRDTLKKFSEMTRLFNVIRSEVDLDWMLTLLEYAIKDLFPPPKALCRKLQKAFRRAILQIRRAEGERRVDLAMNLDIQLVLASEDIRDKDFGSTDVTVSSIFFRIIRLYQQIFEKQTGSSDNCEQETQTNKCNNPKAGPYVRYMSHPERRLRPPLVVWIDVVFAYSVDVFAKRLARTMESGGSFSQLRYMTISGDLLRCIQGNLTIIQNMFQLISIDDDLQNQDNGLPFVVRCFQDQLRIMSEFVNLNLWNKEDSNYHSMPDGHYGVFKENCCWLIDFIDYDNFVHETLMFDISKFLS